MSTPARRRAAACKVCGAACLLWFGAACADRVRVEIEGVEGDMQESARAATDLQKYEDRDVSPAEVRRLFERADEQIRSALEPFGYYEAQVDGRLDAQLDMGFVLLLGR